MRVGVGEAMASTATAALVVGLLVSSDDRVKSRVAELVQHPAATGRAVGERLADLGHLLWIAAREQAAEHAPLVALAVAGAVLLALLART